MTSSLLSWLDAKEKAEDRAPGPKDSLIELLMSGTQLTDKDKINIIEAKPFVEAR